MKRERRQLQSWRLSLFIFAAGPAAGIALPWLQRAGLIAGTRLWVLFALLIACSTSNAIVQIIEPRLPKKFALQLRSAVAAFSTGWFVYACGWGSLTVIAYAIGIADTMRLYGSRAWKPGLAWSAIAIALGQVAVGLGVAPSLLQPGIAQCVAITTFMCLAILARTLGGSADEAERATARVEAGRAYFHDLVQHSADVIALVNDDLCVEYISPGILGIAGHEPSWCINRSIDEVLGVQAGTDIVRAYDHLTLSDYVSCEWFLRNEVGEHRRVLARLTRRRDGSLVLNLRDVTEQRALEEQLERRAKFDELTGLPNRAALIERLRSVSNLADVSVLFIDLDGFKDVNDSLGHEYGDIVLRNVAERIARSVPADIDVGRLGGDEFLAITRVRRRETVEEIARAIIKGTEELGQSTGLPISASIGIAHGTASETPEQLIRRADEAMYAAKKRGPGQFRNTDATHNTARRDEAAAPR